MDKLNLLELTFRKLAADKNFVAYYLERSAALHRQTPAQAMAALGCDAGSYYKLALCQAPDPHHPGFTERISGIAGYAGIAVPALAQLIKEVAASEEQDILLSTRSSVLQNLAARWQNSLPPWLRKAPQLAVRAGLSVLPLLFFILLLSAKVDARYSSFYKSNYSYRDSIKRLCLQDNTYHQLSADRWLSWLKPQVAF